MRKGPVHSLPQPKSSVHEHQSSALNFEALTLVIYQRDHHVPAAWTALSSRQLKPRFPGQA